MSKQQKTTKPVFSSKTKLLPPKQLGQKLVVNTKNLERTLPSISNLLTMRETNIAKLTYQEQIQQESDIQGLSGLQGFIY